MSRSISSQTFKAPAHIHGLVMSANGGYRCKRSLPNHGRVPIRIMATLQDCITDSQVQQKAPLPPAVAWPKHQTSQLPMVEVTGYIPKLSVVFIPLPPKPLQIVTFLDVNPKDSIDRGTLT